MRNMKLWMVIVLILSVGMLLTACSEEGASATENGKPAYVEAVDGSDFDRVVLTEMAAKRLDVQTAAVTEEQVNSKARLVVPYSSVIYGLHGETWVFVSPEPLTFIRTPVAVDFIDGDMAVLVEGPSVGTEVATVGVAELYGIETGVGK